MCGREKAGKRASGDNIRVTPAASALYLLTSHVNKVPGTINPLSYV